MIISVWILPRMRNISDKSWRENQNTFYAQKHFSFPENHVFNVVTWKKCGRARQAADDNISRRTRMACWVTKATDLHSECIIVISFPSRQWLHEHASALRYTYVACLFPHFIAGVVSALQIFWLQIFMHLFLLHELYLFCWINYPVIFIFYTVQENKIQSQTTNYLH